MIEFDYTKTDAYQKGVKKPIRPFDKKDENVIIIGALNAAPKTKILILKDLTNGFETYCKTRLINSYPNLIPDIVSISKALNRAYKQIELARTEINAFMNIPISNIESKEEV